MKKPIPFSLNKIPVMGIVLLILFFVSTACQHRNRLHTDESVLGEKILAEEEQKAILLEENKRTIKPSTVSAGIKFKGRRVSDPSHPPVLLDIIQSRESVRQIKLSQIGQDIQYVKLAHPADSTYFMLGCHLVFTPNYIYAQTQKSIVCFDRTGQFLQEICQNKVEPADFKTSGGVSMVVVRRSTMDQYYGNVGNIQAVGDKLFYQYRDYPNNTGQLITFEPDLYLPSLPNPVPGTETVENFHLGQPVRTFNASERILNFYPIDDQTYGDIRDKMASKTVHNILTIHSVNGDTTCAFTDYDPIINYTNTVGRGTEAADRYTLNGSFHYRPRFNDTIFRLELPDKLIPKYVIGYGGRGISSSMEGIDPRYSLADKFVNGTFVESQSHIFIEYTQDYSCPNTANKGTLKYNRCIYFKNTGDLVHIQKDEAAGPVKEMTWPMNHAQRILNDLDQGVDFWPDGITPEGIPYEQLAMAQLIKRIEESGSTNQRLKEMVSRANPYEYLIITVK
ncbi:MAG TPA: hypothetical protein DC042_06415 [Bacteroidales bacterium]|nr:hypothetical protein [Bacteroidales bacterium]